MVDGLFDNAPLVQQDPVNLSRRRFMLASAGAASGAFVLGFGLPARRARAQAAQGPMYRGTEVPAFLEIRPDNTVRLQSPFIEGGQGTFTAMAQIVGEELDADPATFLVENAPAGDEYAVMDNGMRITGGSMSVRNGYPAMRRLGALGREMLLQAGAQHFGVSVSELTTEPGKVVHASSGRMVNYGELAHVAMDLPVPDPARVKLRDPSQFRWIGKPIKRLDIYEKSTGKVEYAIDVRIDDMLHAAVQHAPRLGMTIGSIRNEERVRQMNGVHSIHRLTGAVAVVAERWWHAKRAVEALMVEWAEAEPGAADTIRVMPADFSTEEFKKHLATASGPEQIAETHGDVTRGLKHADTVVEATYFSQYVNHGQLEPPSTLARFNPDGTLDVWLPNQAPDMFREDIAKRTGMAAEKVTIHSPLLGGFFGRHFLYAHGSPYPQAIALAQATGRPIKLIWSRAEEFLRDALRPMAAVRFRAGLDATGRPVALDVVSATEGATEGLGTKRGKDLDPTALEGLTNKAYQIPDRCIAQLFVRNPAALGYWRSVGNSMNDFLYETFLDELADRGNQDPYELRLHLLRDNKRLTTLLKEVADLSGGWQRGPFTSADGSRRARGIAMASPFGSEAAAITEVSIENGHVRVHEVWEAIDPGKVVNPAIVEAQVNGAVALGLSQVLLEETVYENGMPRARNYDGYPILALNQMPRVHVKIVESGEKMGGVGEPPLPAIPPAVANAVSTLTGRRIRSMPLSRHDFAS